ncbi:hypothetical protein [Nocardia tengchongensis]|uniref:hypothetical protein n=1 Tax=Nocardia tengchongensis TaxID=2055889 RepID=UPI003606C9FF
MPDIDLDAPTPASRLSRSGNPAVITAIAYVSTALSLAEFAMPSTASTGAGFTTALSSVPVASVVAYLAGFAVAAIIVGARGRRIAVHMPAIGLAGFAITSVITAAGDDGTWTAAARALQGASAGVLVVAALATLISTSAPELVIASAAAWYASTAAALVFGPIVLAALVGVGSWSPSILLCVQAALCAVLALLHERALPRSSSRQPHGLALTPVVAVIVGVATAVNLTLLASATLYSYTAAALTAAAVILVAVAWLVSVSSPRRHAATPAGPASI